MIPRVRIAPSPTGNLHIGTARTAVFNWLYARHFGGKFILRIEDTDESRSRMEYTQNILDGLIWLGLTWDEGPFFQSQRLDLYRSAIRKLLDQGIAYPCYCTETELETMREAQKASGRAPRYDNRHRNLTPTEIKTFEAEGRKPVIRFKIEDDRSIVWNDLVRGNVTWKGSDLGGDMVIARASESSDQVFGQPLYNLAVVVDDIDMNITHVIRGEDHIANTAKQILLYEALGATLPEFAHTPLILNESGQKLSKRDGVTSIFDFKDMGYTPAGLVNYMMLLGWTPVDSTVEIFSLASASELFNIERVNKAGAKFDWNKLNWINSQHLHQTPIEEALHQLTIQWKKAGYGFDLNSDRPWLELLASIITPSLSRWDEGIAMAKPFFIDSIEYNPEATTQLASVEAKTVIKAVLLNISADTTITSATANDIIKQITKQHNLKKGVVMKSIRAALTGEVHGPDLIQSWVILDQKGVARSRLEKIK